MSQPPNLSRRKNGSKGFSLIEMLFAVGILAIAMLGSLAMIAAGIGRNSSMRMDTTAANVAQTVLEDIATGKPNTNGQMNITDCAGNALAITTNPGGSLLVQAPPKFRGTNLGDIDFAADPVPGYQLTYMMCGAAGAQIPFEVRWRVDSVNGVWAKLVTVAARQPLAVRNGTLYYSPPVTLRTVVGM
jgi:prepilin-type N-terminal cleavage/methylation domain-containing protein